MTYAKIIGTGSYLPEKILTNHDLAKTVDTNHEWIVERTGIVQRHIAAENQTTSDIAFEAAQRALKNADIKADTLDAIIVATTTPDLTFPSTASILGNKLQAGNTPAFDIQAVCTGFIYALHTANLYIKSKEYKRVLVVGADTISRIVDWKDRNTCILFGDGAGAAVLEATEEKTGILASKIYADGSTKDLLKTTGGASYNQQTGYITMEGKEVFKHAVSKLAACSLEAIELANIAKDDIDWVIPHQANQRILSATIKKLGLPEKKLISSVANHANTSAASIPLALDKAVQENKIRKNNLIAMQAIGGGLTWGSAVVKY